MLREQDLHTRNGREGLAATIASDVLEPLATGDDIEALPLYRPLAVLIAELIEQEDVFSLPGEMSGAIVARSEIWEAEDRLLSSAKLLDNFDEAIGRFAALVEQLIAPLIRNCPALVSKTSTGSGDIAFPTALSASLTELPTIVERMVLAPFSPELDEYHLTDNLRARLERQQARMHATRFDMDQTFQ